MAKRLIRDEGGATAVEYAILAATIAAGVVIIVLAIGQEVDAEFAKVCNEFAKAVSGVVCP